VGRLQWCRKARIFGFSDHGGTEWLSVVHFRDDLVDGTRYRTGEISSLGLFEGRVPGKQKRRLYRSHTAQFRMLLGTCENVIRLTLDRPKGCSARMGGDVNQTVLHPKDTIIGMDPEIGGVLMPDLPLREIRHPSPEDFKMATL